MLAFEIFNCKPLSLLLRELPRLPRSSINDGLHFVVATADYLS